MRCHRALELISKRVDNELAFEERESLLDHLKSCASCAEISQAYEADAFRVRRALRQLRPRKLEFVQKTLALITEHVEPHREVAPAEEQGARKSLWQRSAVWAVPAAAVILGVAAYQIVDPVRSIRWRTQQDTIDQQELEIARLEEALGKSPVSPDEPAAAGSVGALKGTEDEPDSRKRVKSDPGVTAKSVSADTDAESAGEGDLPAEREFGDLGSVQAKMQALLEALDANEFPRALSLAKAIGDMVLEVSSLSDQLAGTLGGILKSRLDLSLEDRVRLTEMLAKIRSDSAASFFRDELRDNQIAANVSLRRALAEGLATNADTNSVTRDLLQQLAFSNAEDHLVRSHAARGLLQIASDTEDASLFGQLKQLAFLEVADPRLRLDVIQMLGTNPNTPQVVDFLSEVALLNAVQDERVAAIDGLANLPSATAQRALEQLAQNALLPPDLRSRARRGAERVQQALRLPH